jgi:hypothetical protein
VTRTRLLGVALAAAIITRCFALRADAQVDSGPSPAAVTLPRIVLSQSQLAGLPRRSVTVTEDAGQAATYSGVDLGALLAKNGAPHGEALHGPAVADYVVVQARDGYRAVFTLVELDPRFTDKVVLLADQRDGAPLGSDLGPFRIIVPDEKHHARWVRNATDITVRTTP